MIQEARFLHGHLFNWVCAPFRLRPRPVAVWMCRSVQQIVQRDQICLSIPTGSMANSRHVAVGFARRLAGSQGALSIRGVLPGQTWQDLAWLCSWDRIGAAGPRARMDPLEADSLELKSFRCSPFEVCVLLVISTMIKILKNRFQSIGYDYNEQSSNQGEVKTEKAERYVSRTPNLLLIGVHEILCQLLDPKMYPHPEKSSYLIVAHCAHI